jgi:nitrate reductase (cytochrome), electron transfer subunit
MRCTTGTRLAAAFAVACAAACASPGTGSREPGVVARSMEQRAAGRAYDGAPPVIPHAIVGECTTCHDDDGSEIGGVGVAPASPHGTMAAMGALRRCRQCHVSSTTPELMVASAFSGLPQGPWPGGRATPGAPPTIPHTQQLRENCLACHAGPASRVEIRTSHPERPRCRQCHVPQY